MGNVMIGSTGTLNGKYVQFYFEGESKPVAYIIKEAAESKGYRYNDLILEFNQGQERVPYDKVKDFNTGKIVIVKSGKGFVGLKLKK